MATKKRLSTEEVLQEMFQENTGTHFLDSGSAYGRNWQRMQGVDFDSLRHTVEFERHGNASDSDYYINLTINSYLYLVDNLKFNQEWTEKFSKFANRKENRDDAWLVNMENWVESLRNKHEVNGIYGEGEPWICNTYNGETDLSQHLQYIVFEVDGEELVILSVHGGCDIRGGYTEPKVFNPRNGLDSFVDNGRNYLAIGCKEGHAWYKEGYDEYVYNEREINQVLTDTLFGDELVEYTHLVKPLQEYTADELDINEEGQAFCPACMLLNKETRNPLQP